MLFFMKFIARVPNQDSNIAWKISGPGISRTVFKSMSIEDVMTLLHCELEKL
jgi:hypothetical protein